MSPVFEYHAKNGSGEYKDGTIEAENQKDASMRLSTQGLFLISIKMMEAEGKKLKIVEQKMVNRPPLWRILIPIGIIFFILTGLLRVYYGGGIGCRIVKKDSFSL